MKLFHNSLAICILLLLGCAQNQAQNQVEIIDKETLVQLIDDQETLTIIDVRTTSHFWGKVSNRYLRLSLDVSQGVDLSGEPIRVSVADGSDFCIWERSINV